MKFELALVLMTMCVAVVALMPNPATSMTESSFREETYKDYNLQLEKSASILSPKDFTACKKISDDAGMVDYKEAIKSLGLKGKDLKACNEMSQSSALAFMMYLSGSAPNNPSGKWADHLETTKKNKKLADEIYDKSKK